MGTETIGQIADGQVEPWHSEELKLRKNRRSEPKKLQIELDIAMAFDPELERNTKNRSGTIV